ncbi:hypothetical protein [Cytophaga sp. FL35]|nr:hypothetical protein [Cytophaga sp. FL35]MBC6999279.1 hypothetical protein [Cytophaga sp. FL35]
MKTKKASTFVEAFAVWTGLEFFVEISHFSRSHRGAFLRGTELLTF